MARTRSAGTAPTKSHTYLLRLRHVVRNPDASSSAVAGDNASVVGLDNEQETDDVCSSYELCTEIDKILNSESKTSVFKLGVASTTNYFTMSCATMFIAEYLYTKYVGLGSCICRDANTLHTVIHATVKTKYEEWFAQLREVKIKIDTWRTFRDKIYWGRKCIAAIHQHLCQLGYNVTCSFIYRNLSRFEDLFEEMSGKETSSMEDLQQQLNDRLNDPSWMSLLQDILGDLNLPPPISKNTNKYQCKKGKSGTTNNPSRRRHKNEAQPKPRKRQKTPFRKRNDDHFQEDKNIPKNTKKQSTPKPGCCPSPQSAPPTSSGPLTRSDPPASCSPSPQLAPPASSTNRSPKFGLMFSGKTKQYHMNLTKDCPYIVVEVFRDGDGNIVKGELTQEKTGEIHEVGAADYVKNLSEAYIVPSSSAYMYCFKHAKLCPHFLLTNIEVSEYVKKLLTYGDVSIRKLGSWQHNHGPVKILSDGTLEEGLREGKHQDSMFTFFSHTTRPYLEFCDVSKMHFPLDAWMRYFDEKEAKSVLNGNIAQEKLRGLRFPFDGGWGRNGVHEKRITTQEKGKEYVCAQPTLINADVDIKVGDHEFNAYETFQEPLDALATIAEEYIFDANGDPVYGDKNRDAIFGEPLRQKTKCKKTGAEAFTFVRQKVNPKCRVDQGYVNSKRLTKRHLDGPDSGEEGYNITCILSFHVVHKGFVYRMTLIAYTRQSCGDWINRNNYSRYLRQALRDYQVEYNGHLLYQDFTLCDDMSKYKVLTIGRDRQLVHNVFIPPKTELTDSFYDRYRENMELNNKTVQEDEEPWKKFNWKHFESNPSNYELKWMDFDWEKKFDPPLKIIGVREFINRFAYVSIYSHTMNTFFAKHKPPYEKRIPILYFALLSTSGCLFSFILNRLSEELTELSLEKISAVNLFRKCQQISDRHKFNSFNGGPYGRYQPQPIFPHDNNAFGHKYVPKSGEQWEETPDGKLQIQLALLAQALSELDAGDCLCPKTNKMIRNVCADKKIHALGDVSSLSFPSLCVFTGFCSSESAIETAQQAMPNVRSKNSYFAHLCRYINHHGGYNLKPKPAEGKKILRNAFFSVADSWNTSVQCVENGSCCKFRTLPRYDVFLEGMDMYDIKPSILQPIQIKRFNSDKWVPIKFKEGILTMITDD